jgi:hypothetical protein
MMFSMSHPPAAVSVRSMEADGIPTIFNRVPNENAEASSRAAIAVD